MTDLYAVTDTETGGLLRKTDAVLQLATTIVDEDINAIDSFMSYIYPPAHLLCRVQALASNGIDMMKVLTAPSEPEVIRDYEKFLSRHVPKGGKLIFAAYNAPYDFGMLEEVQARTGIKLSYFQPEIPPEGLKEPPYLCLLKMARSLVRSVKNHQLKTMAAHFNLSHLNAHDAHEDVLTSIEVWRQMRKL